MIAEVQASHFARLAPGLATLLQECVADGASIGFVAPFSGQDASQYWQHKVAGKLGQPRFSLWVVEVAGEVAATVQLDAQTPANQRHRGEVAKLMVSPRYRRQGLARQLLATLEEKARQWQLTLLTLDTRTGDKAEPLYLAMGYQVAGCIPGFALSVDGSRLDATTLMYKGI